MSIRAKSVDDYLALPYTIEVIHDPSGEQAGWFARVVELPGCMTQTEHFDELEKMVRDAMRAWIVTALEADISVPEPEVEGAYSGHLTVRVPRSLHRDLAVAAAQDGVILSTFGAAALGRTLGASALKAHAMREEAADYTSPNRNA